MFYATFFVLLIASAAAQVCPTTDEITIDFDTDASGAALAAGTVITNQYESLAIGVTFEGESTDKPPYPAMIFDSANPNSKDLDIGTPNEMFGGPGKGGPGSETNSVARGNVLILSEDGSSADPNDNHDGGVIKITFAQPITLLSVDVLDIDDENLKIQTFNDAGNKTSSSNALDVGDNSYQRIDVGVEAVKYALIKAKASFAISGLAFVCDECPEDCNKMVPGVCGCGQLDTDSDGDGTPDCIDECPMDANKTAAGVCGCGADDAGAESSCDCQDQVCDCPGCSRGETSTRCLCPQTTDKLCVNVIGSIAQCAREITTAVGTFTIRGSNKKRSVEADNNEIVVNQNSDATYTMDIPSGVQVTKDRVVSTGETVKSGEQNSAIVGSSTSSATSVVFALVSLVIAVFFSL